jgi:putative ABC transport system ATP-binding protein
VSNGETAASAHNPILRVHNLRKAYYGLRPLRIASLQLMPGERVTVAGLDAPAAELMVNLVTGAALPDDGDVWTMGRRTADIKTGEEWLAWLDHFGIVSERGVLLEGATLEQNLAMPFTLEIDPVPRDTADRVAALARECGLSEALLAVPAAQLSPEARVRTHLARAVALAPRLLLIEHPTGRVSDAARGPLAGDVAHVCDARALAALVLTNDDAFARGVARTNLKLDAATGELRPLKKGWFSG